MFLPIIRTSQSSSMVIRSSYWLNITRINHALESMTKELADARVKLENVERQLDTAKIEVTKPFAQEAELAEKPERLSALNALLNMDGKGGDAASMEDDVPDQAETDTFGHDVQKTEQAAVADKPVHRVSLKEKLEAYRAQAARTGKLNNEKAKRKRYRKFQLIQREFQGIMILRSYTFLGNGFYISYE